MTSRVRPGVPTGGQFAATGHGESDMALAPPAGPDLTAQTPVDIDDQLAEIYGREATARQEVERSIGSAHATVGDRRQHGRGYATWKMTDEDVSTRLQEMASGVDYTASQAARALKSMDDTAGHLAAVRRERAPFEAEFNRRGRWNRAFLVTNGDGHVHRSMGCSTCNRGASPTDFAWMTQYSGADEPEIVAAAAYRACTSCYPSAPIGDSLSLPSQMSTPNEREKAEASRARDDRKAQIAADRITKGLTGDGSEFVVSYVEPNAGGWERDTEGRRVHVSRDRERHESFKTERAAVQWYLDAHTYGASESKKPAFEAIEEAVAAKYGKTAEEVRTEFVAKVAAKRKRDGW